MRTKIDIRRAIKERFGTVSAFAAHAGMHTQNVLQNLINGNPSIKKLEELCEKMGCDVTDLFYPIDEAGDENNANEAQTFAESKKMTGQPQTYNIQSNAAPVIQVQPAFCPHCGKQVRVGVVLLPEE
jgi:hypothetical protein